MVSPVFPFVFALVQAQAPSIPPEPARAVQQAKAAQGRFERGRRQWLPVTGGGGGRCDARIGRFCYWYDDRDTSLPRDPEPVQRERNRLIATLATTSALAPGDDWTWGHLVRYLIDADQADSAIAAAARCRGTPWWCQALTGLSSHAAGRFDVADQAFAAALAAMPAEIRCRWMDWDAVVPDAIDPRLDCAARIARMDTVWWLAKPLLATAGNDLRTEFFARRVMAAIQSTGTPPQLLGWGGDLEELMLRYGWSKRWSVASYPAASTEPPSLIGHDRPPAYWFFPTPGDSLLPWRWDLDAERPPSRYGPGYADRIETTDDATIAMFPRGDSAVVVAAFGPRVTLDPATDLVLTASPDPGSHVSTRLDSVAPTTPLLLRMAGTPRLIGLEARSDRGRRFLRGRRYLPTGREQGPLFLSDPLLFRVDSTLPTSLEEVAPRVVGAHRVSRRVPIGVYWEWSNQGGDSIRATVSVTPARRGLVGRIVRSLTAGARPVPLTLEWQSGAAPDRIEGRAVELDLSRLGPGRYHLRLGAAAGTRRAASTVTIELLP